MSRGSHPRIVITGALGFLGWHTAVRLRSVHGIEPVRLGRQGMQDPARLADELRRADAVIHLAGVNRAGTDAEVEQGNIQTARTLEAALGIAATKLRVVNANSIQAGNNTAYGQGKATASAVLRSATYAAGGFFDDVELPNLFGEHGRPFYNSFVATFCHQLANGVRPEIHTDREVALLHAQDAAECLISRALGKSAPVEGAQEIRSVGEILDILRQFNDTYARGEIPSLPDAFTVSLFNTFRSHLFPSHFPIRPQIHRDSRGDLFETVRVHGGGGMAFASTTEPGQKRGDHYHLTKIERFFVVSGHAEIALRKLYDDRVVRFTLGGDGPGFVDMPTMWAHNITNVGDERLVTMFWSDQLLDPHRPDQYPEPVEEASR